jgi:hypothetical protein
MITGPAVVATSAETLLIDADKICPFGFIDELFIDREAGSREPARRHSRLPERCLEWTGNASRFGQRDGRRGHVVSTSVATQISAKVK